MLVANISFRQRRFGNILENQNIWSFKCWKWKLENINFNLNHEKIMCLFVLEFEALLASLWTAKKRFINSNAEIWQI